MPRRQALNIGVSPDDPAAVADSWIRLAPPDVVLRLVAHCSSRPVALPIFFEGIRWPVGSVEGLQIADLRCTAATAAALLPSALFRSVMGIGGLVAREAYDAATGLPAFRDAMRVRRPDIYWFVAACHEIVRRVPVSAKAALEAARSSAWHVQPGTAFASALQGACAAVDARFASPGGDVCFPGAGLSMAPRDKMIVLLVLLFGEDYRWAIEPPPGCAPKAIRAAATAFADLVEPPP